jgi:hypothetical protein
LKYFSMLINFSKSPQITLCTDYSDRYNKNSWSSLGTFLKQAQNLSLLMIFSFFVNYKYTPIMETIYSIIPSHGKHLHVPMSSLDQTKILLQRCEYLSTVQFEIESLNISDKIIEWLNENTINSRFIKERS